MVNEQSHKIRNKSKLRIISIAAILVVVGGVLVWYQVIRAGGDRTNNFATFTVTRGPLTISVLESCDIEWSQHRQLNPSELPATRRGDANRGRATAQERR